MKRIFQDNLIASHTAGSHGNPGSSFEIIEIEVALYDDDLYEVQANYSRGSNQGYLEKHKTLTTRARDNSLERALAQISPDVLEWECNITIPERRAAIRECEIEAQEWLEEHPSAGNQPTTQPTTTTNQPQP